MSKYLTRDEVLAASDIDIGEVDVPEWGEGAKVLVKGLDAQYVNWLIEKGFIKATSGGGQEADISKLDFVELAARSLVDEKGEKLLTRNEMKQMGGKSFAVVSRIAQKALELSGLTEEEEEAERPNG